MRVKTGSYESPFTAYTRRLSVPRNRNSGFTQDASTSPEFRIPKELVAIWGISPRGDQLYSYLGEEGMLISPDPLPGLGVAKFNIRAQQAVRTFWRLAKITGATEGPQPISILTWREAQRTERMALVNSPVLMAKRLGELSIDAVPGMSNTDWERIDGFRLRLAESTPGSTVRLGSDPLEATPAAIVLGAFTQLVEAACTPTQNTFPPANN